MAPHRTVNRRFLEVEGRLNEPYAREKGDDLLLVSQHQFAALHLLSHADREAAGFQYRLNALRGALPRRRPDDQIISRPRYIERAAAPKETAYPVPISRALRHRVCDGEYLRRRAPADGEYDPAPLLRVDEADALSFSRAAPFALSPETHQPPHDEEAGRGEEIIFTLHIITHAVDDSGRLVFYRLGDRKRAPLVPDGVIQTFHYMRPQLFLFSRISSMIVSERFCALCRRYFPFLISQ